MLEKRQSDHQHSEEGTELRDLQTISRDGKHLAVVNAEDIQDGLMIIPGNRCEQGQVEERRPPQETVHGPGGDRPQGSDPAAEAGQSIQHGWSPLE